MEGEGSLGRGGGLLGLLWQLQLRSDDSWQPVPVKPTDVDTVGQMTQRRNGRIGFLLIFVPSLPTGRFRRQNKRCGPLTPAGPDSVKPK